MLINLRTKNWKAVGEEKQVAGASLQTWFHGLTILLKYEAWKVDVLQKGVRRLKELLILVRPWETKDT